MPERGGEGWGRSPGTVLRAGPLAGVVIGAALGAAVFLLAALIHGRFSGARAPVAAPPHFEFGSGARLPVRVLATMGGEGIRAVLLPLREDGGSTAAAETLLDGALFPGAEPRRWARLLVSNPAGGSPWRLDLAPGAVVLLGGPGGPLPSEDLAAAFAARAASLGEHRRLELRTFHVADASVEVPPGGSVRVLVAFPGGADPGTSEGATLRGVRLLPRDVAVESLRTALAEGRVDALVDADRAEAPSNRGDGGPR